jgi:hypothetical protein
MYISKRTIEIGRGYKCRVNVCTIIPHSLSFYSHNFSHIDCRAFCHNKVQERHIVENDVDKVATVSSQVGERGVDEIGVYQSEIGKDGIVINGVNESAVYDN